MNSDRGTEQIADFVTIHAWRKPAGALAARVAEAGVRPAWVWLVSAVLAALAFILFYKGSFWLGVLVGFVSSLLGAVSRDLSPITDKLARVIEYVVAPFWWWAWLHGLDASSTPLEPVYATMLFLAIAGGYAVELIVEQIFRHRFGRLSIHAWQMIDTRFRLIGAGRNVNLSILTVSLLFGRPDTGIELVALWTLISLIFHAVRLAQASALHDRGEPVTSWLA